MLKLSMVGKELVAYLKLIHGAFNSLVFLLFCYQGVMGLKIRRSRRAGLPLAVSTVKRHRKAGPVFAGLGILGYAAGLTVGYLDHGLVLEHPLHLTFGSVLVAVIVLTLMLSRRIKGPHSRWRTPHFWSGLGLLCLYFVQVFIGLGILL